MHVNFFLILAQNVHLVFRIVYLKYRNFGGLNFLQIKRLFYNKDGKDIFTSSHTTSSPRFSTAFVVCVTPAKYNKNITLKYNLHVHEITTYSWILSS